jgi:hypothetical protein
MDILESIYKYLRLNNKLTNIVGDNIFPQLIPQGKALPAVVYSPVRCHYDSALQKDTGFSRLMVQFNCYDETFVKARKLGKVIKKVFRNYRGDMFGSDIQAVFIRSDYMTISKLKVNYDADRYASIIEIEFYYMED